MTETCSLEEKQSLRTWLLNPFHYLAGGAALAVGLAAILAASLNGYFSHSHFDGVLDFHTGAPAPWWIFVAEGVLNWFIMSILLLDVGWLISKSRIRIIDVFGTQALARVPTLIPVALAMLPGYQRQTARFMAMDFTMLSPDFLVFLGAGLCIVAVMIWIVILMYRAFSISCNVQGAKAIGMFILTLVLGEIISKMAIFLLFFYCVH